MIKSEERPCEYILGLAGSRIVGVTMTATILKSIILNQSQFSKMKPIACDISL